ncbi:MAG: hypothetical protein ABI627_00595 [Polyangiaceae bacterium]
MSERDPEASDMQSPFERTLLLSARADAPPPEAAQQAWLRFSGVLATTAVSSGSLHAGAVAAGSGWVHFLRASPLKHVLIGAIGGGALTFAWFQAHPERAREVAPPELRIVSLGQLSAPPSSAAPLASEPLPAPPPRAAAPLHAAAPLRAASASSALHAREQLLTSGAPRTPTDRKALESAGPSTLAAETAALDAARNASAGGAFHRALSLLAQYQQEFPRGVLRSDAEVATIETLNAAGQRAEAARRAMQFLVAYPNDPHSSTLKRLFAR